MVYLWGSLAFLSLLTLVSFFWLFAPYVPTRSRHLKLINELANLAPGQIFYELGCGDARVSRFIAQHNHQAQIIGLEFFWAMFLVAKITQILSPAKNLQIKFQNVFWQDLRQADVVYIFGMTSKLNKKLQTKLLVELKPSARVISYIFEFKDWPGQCEVHEVPDNKAKIRVYTK